MTNFLSHIFAKKEIVDEDKLALKAQLSVQSCVADTYLIALASTKNNLIYLEEYLRASTLIDATQKHHICDEINLLERYIESYKYLCGSDLFVTFSAKTLAESEFYVYPFILMPLIQNAIHFGYNTMEKYPIRIKINAIGDKVKMEVSNRTNHYLENQGSTQLIEYLVARLNITYPSSHELIINSNSNIFKATLILE